MKRPRNKDTVNIDVNIHNNINKNKVSINNYNNVHSRI